ncbi:hypothetical protein GCM10020001_083640 [Nonomuraea salmonea]
MQIAAEPAQGVRGDHDARLHRGASGRAPLLLEEEPEAHAFVERGVPADEGSGHDPAGPDGAAGLAQRAQPVGALGQVVERAEQQHRVGIAVGDRQVASVAEAGGHAGQLRRLAHVQRHRVDHLDLVALGGQPFGVHAGAAAHVEHAGRRRRQGAQQHVARAPELQPAATLAQPRTLTAALVVGHQSGIRDHVPGSYGRSRAGGEAISPCGQGVSVSA